MIETAQKEERVLLVAVQTGDEWETQESLDELAELVRTAGGIVVGRITQARERIHPGTYIGKGKGSRRAHRDAGCLVSGHGRRADPRPV